LECSLLNEMLAAVLLPCLSASAFLGGAPLPAPAARRSSSVQLNFFENFKTGVFCAASGSIASAPVKASAMLANKEKMDAMVEFSNYALAGELAVFGIIYRYACRSDDDDFLKAFIIGAFAFSRALEAVHNVKTMWSPDMWMQLGVYFGSGCVAFGFAAFSLEFAWRNRWCRRLPTTEVFYQDYYRDFPANRPTVGGRRTDFRPDYLEDQYLRDEQRRYLRGGSRDFVGARPEEDPYY